MQHFGPHISTEHCTPYVKPTLQYTLHHQEAQPLCFSVPNPSPPAFKQDILIKCKAAFKKLIEKCTPSTWSSFYLNIKVSLSELILLVCTCLTRTIFFHLVKTKEFRSFCKLTLPSLCCILLTYWQHSFQFKLD